MIHRLTSTQPTPGLYPKNTVSTQFASALPVEVVNNGTSQSNPNAALKYVLYTPDNTPSPLATFHSLYSPEAWVTHALRGKTLKEYLDRRHYKDIPWIRSVRSIDEVAIKVFDTETTGLDPNIPDAVRQNTYYKLRQRIIQFATSEMKAKPKKALVRHRDTVALLHPGYVDTNGQKTTTVPDMFPIEREASNIHGIDADDLVNRPTLFDPDPDRNPHVPTNIKKPPIMVDIRKNLLGERDLLAAYNAVFDTAYTNQAIIEGWNAKRGNRRLRPLDIALILDPFILIQRIHPFVSTDKSLGAHYRLIMGEDLAGAHDALADVHATADVLKYILLYLKKHLIPIEWAQFAGQFYPKGPGGKVTLADKEAFIARVIRENRPMFEKAFPKHEIPLLTPVDILFFQHGTMPTHEPGLPKLDIPLNIYGWDGTKSWRELSLNNWRSWDLLDRELVTIIRQQREKENIAYLQARFIDDWVETRKGPGERFLKMVSEEQEKDKTYFKAKRKDLEDLLTTKLGQQFVDAVMMGQRITTTEDNLKPVIRSLLEEFLSQRRDLVGNVKSMNKIRKKRLPEAVSSLTRHLLQTQEDLQGQYFYRRKPVVFNHLMGDDVKIMLQQMHARRANPKIREYPSTPVMFSGVANNGSAHNPFLNGLPASLGESDVQRWGRLCRE